MCQFWHCHLYLFSDFSPDLLFWLCSCFHFDQSLPSRWFLHCHTKSKKGLDSPSWLVVVTEEEHSEASSTFSTPSITWKSVSSCFLGQQITLHLTSAVMSVKFAHWANFSPFFTKASTARPSTNRYWRLTFKSSYFRSQARGLQTQLFHIDQTGCFTPRSFDTTNFEPSTHPLPSSRTFSKSIQWHGEAFRIVLPPAFFVLLLESASETSDSPASACARKRLNPILA